MNGEEGSGADMSGQILFFFFFFEIMDLKAPF